MARWALELGGLGSVGPQKFVFERGAIEAANNGLHLVSSRRFDKGEPFRFLCFVIADYFDRIRNEVIGGEPSFDVVSGDPCG